MRLLIHQLYTTVFRCGQYGLFIFALALLPVYHVHAATDAVKAFTGRMDGFSAVSKPFPEKFEVFDLNDNKITLAFGKDQPWRLINFWAGWCAPCVAEMPTLKALQDKTKNLKTFKVILVSADMPVKGEALKYMIKKQNLPDVDAVYSKDFYLWQTFELEGIPTTLLVSPEGKIAYTMIGDADWDSKESDAFFKAVLPASTFP